MTVYLPPGAPLATAALIWRASVSMIRLPNPGMDLGGNGTVLLRVGGRQASAGRRKHCLNASDNRRELKLRP